MAAEPAGRRDRDAAAGLAAAPAARRPGLDDGRRDAAGAVPGIRRQVAAIFFVLIVLAYTAGAHLPRRPALLALPVLFAGISGVNLGMTPRDHERLPVPRRASPILSWLAGRARPRPRAADRGAARGRDPRRGGARGRARSRAMAEERRRIAREMHDVVAHSVSVMVVQAGGARRIIDRDPERAARGARRRSSTPGAPRWSRCAGCSALLHAGDDDAARSRRSRRWPSSTRWSSALARRGAAGRRCVVEGEPRPLPGRASTSPPTASCRRRSPTRSSTRGAAPTDGARALARATSSSSRSSTAARRTGARPRRRRGGGHGLVGMRERVALYGGELAGRAPRAAAASASGRRLPLEERERR